ncbi:MAG: hypothetical protein AAGD25_29535 [Cyanobacteria bacterium P01_F01_bin.150]
MIIGMVLLLVAITIWVVGSIPWLLLNYLICFPEPSIGCASPTAFANKAQYVICFNLLLCIVAGFVIAHLRKLHRRYRRRQQLASQNVNPVAPKQ